MELIKEAVIAWDQTGSNDNMFVAMASWRQQARAQGVSQENIAKVLDLVMQTPWPGSLGVLLNHGSKDIDEGNGEEPREEAE